jgi:hypothetical protein
MTAPRWLAGVLLGVLVLHAVLTKLPDKLPELLWCCHVATVVMAVGLATRNGGLVAAGLIFHVAVGVPSYMIDSFTRGTTTPTSVLVHLLPSVVGGYAVRRADIRPSTAALAWGMFAVLLPICYLATPAALNVNLSHASWAELRFAGPVGNWLVNLAVTAVAITGAAIVLHRVVPTRAAHVDA